ncbi:peptide ABC transporter permease [Methanobrevibacter sp.]|uniref:peptide ABC transporter permease n=1 Tax=Methanobrevibacter sp. TaxID=66852 RepID=UPI00386C1587
MDLMGGYLLICSILFSANLALLIGNFKLDNLKVVVLSLISAIVAFVLINASNQIKQHLLFLLGYFTFIFLIIAIAVFLIMLYYLKKEEIMLPIYSISAIAMVLSVLLSSQSSLTFFDTILYSLFVFIVFFVVYQLSKLLMHAKRPYPVIIGEFMSLFAILLFIFALTYYSTFTLDYSMFSSFLILTPLYQLMYLIIGIVVLMVVGVLLNESYGGNS